MSFDAKLDELIASMNALTVALKEVIGLAPAAGAKTETAAEKKKRLAAEAEANKGSEANNGSEAGNENADGPVDTAALTKFIKETLAPWLGEFGNADSGHPETVARQEALAKALKTLGVEKASKITKGSDYDRLVAWHKKALDKDAGFGKGRFAADPKGDDDAGGGDDDI